MEYLTPKEAKEQAADYWGFTPSVPIEVEGGKVFEIPNPALMDDDQQERWEELQYQLESCDRAPDGEYLTPYRVDGELLKPPYNVRLAQALWGEDGYAEYKAGGGISSQIGLEWTRMSEEYQANE